MSRLEPWPPIEGPESYETVAAGPEVEIKIKGSRFLGQAFPAPAEEAARAAWGRVRKRHHDARHHCAAFRVGGPVNPKEIADDDGEPSQTGGAPILAVLRGEEIADAIVVVTRYFGGVKLGTGGLIRAYGDAAREALAATARERVWRDLWFAVLADYGDMGPVEALLAREAGGIVQVERDFGAVPRFRVRARRTAARPLAEALFEATSGRARIRLESSEDRA